MTKTCTEMLKKKRENEHTMLRTIVDFLNTPNIDTKEEESKIKYMLYVWCIVFAFCNFVIDFKHTQSAHFIRAHTIPYSMLFNNKKERNSIQFNKYHIAVNKHENDERGCASGTKERRR